MDTTELTTTIGGIESQSKVLEAQAAHVSGLIPATIADAAQYQDAAKLLAQVKGLGRTLKETEMASKRPLTALAARITAVFRPALDILHNAESRLKGMMDAFNAEQDRIQRAEQARLDAIAERERARLAALAVKAEQRGDERKAEQFVERQAAVLAPVAAPRITKVEGVHTTKTYTFEIEDESKLPREYLVPDTVKIGRVVRAMKDSANIPGVRVIVKTGIASRAAF